LDWRRPRFIFCWRNAFGRARNHLFTII
jgi:hypothetical protein